MTVVIQSGATNVQSINVLHSSILEDATLTVSSEDADYAGANAIDDPTWNAWKPVAGTADIVADYGSAVACDAFGVAAHNLASMNVGIALAHSTDNVTYTDVFASYTPLTDDDLLFLFPSVSRRYWRVRLIAAGADRSSIGVLKLGAKLAFPSGVLTGHVPLHHARKITMLSNTSMGGHLLGNRVEKREAMTSVDAGMVDRSFAETDLLMFENNYNNGRSFFYCGDPTNTPKDFGYCWRPEGGDTMGITWVEGDIMATVQFEVKSYVGS